MSVSQDYCATCGAANPPGASSCFACGQALPLAAPQPSASSTSAGSALTGLLAPDSLLKQRYRLRRQVGKGGFGAVYQAEDTDLGNRPVAVKEMSHSGLRSQELQEATEAFHREALLLAGLSHPSLPRIYDHFSQDGRWYLVMDFIEGETLEAVLSKMPGGRLPPPRALKIGLQLCSVLEYLHTRQPPIIFRDLKPSNVLLTADGALYLVDFGIARFFKPGQAKDTVAFGSPGYAAPEQYGKAQTTPRSDIYGLGALLHHLLSGHDPSETPFRFAPLDAPGLAEMSRLIAQMVQLDETSRPANMAAVRQALETLAAEAANGQRASRQLLVSGQQSAVGSSPSPTRPPRSHAPGLGAAYARSVLPTYKGHTGRVNALAWSPDGKRIVSGSADRTAQVWDVASGKTIWTYAARLKWVLAVAWSPDGRCIASGSDDETVQVWDADNAQPFLTCRGNGRHARTWVDRSMRALAWSPDGKWIASAGGQMVQVWDANTQGRVATRSWVHFGTRTVRIWEEDKPLLVYHGHAEKVFAVAWSPDGQHIASGGADGTVQIWDAQTGEPLFTYHGHSGPVSAVAWSPDGKWIASGGADATVQVWDAR